MPDAFLTDEDTAFLGGSAAPQGNSLWQTFIKGIQTPLIPDEYYDTPGELISKALTAAPSAPQARRSLGTRAVQAAGEAGAHNPIGFEADARAMLKKKGYSAAQINQLEKRYFAQQQKQNEADPVYRVGDEGGSILRGAANLAGSVAGGFDPTYLLAPGRNAVIRILAQMGVNAGQDVGAQGIEIKRGVRDKLDPWETVLNAVVGGVTQGGVEVHGKYKTGQMINRGSQYPEYSAFNDVIVNHLEGGGTLENPKTSKKGAMGPQQVMMATAMKPGFHIRPWDGKTQADLARLGRQYSAALLDHYKGDTAKALGAYNGGVGKVDGLIEKYGDNWLRHMPTETRRYVDRGTWHLSKQAINEGRTPPKVYVSDAANAPKLDNIDHIPDEMLDRIDSVWETPENEQLYRAATEQANAPDNVVDFQNARTQKRDASFSKATEDNYWMTRTLADHVLNGGETDLAKLKENRDLLDRSKTAWAEDTPEHQNIQNTLDLHNQMISELEGRPRLSNDPFIDQLTPAERQDMDASAPKPVNRNTGAEDILGKGSVATTPVNDLRDGTDPNYDRNQGPTIPEMPPKPGEEPSATWQEFLDNPDRTHQFGGSDEPPEPPHGLEAFTAALKEAKKAGPEQRKLRREELKKRYAEMAQRRQYTEGEAGVHAEKGALKGQMPRVDIEPLRGKITDEELTGLLESLKNSRKLSGFESLNARDAVIGMMDGRLPTKSEMALLYRVHPDLVKEILKKRPWSEKAKDYLMRAFETTRSQMGSGDISFGGRQGLSMISRPEYWKATAGEIKALSPTKGDQLLSEQTERIVNSRHYERAKEADLHLMDLGADREEYAPHGLIEDIPVFGQIPKASNRAYTYMANELRFTTFSNFLDKAEAAGKDIDDPAFLKAAGEWVNTFTGRGQFGKGPIGKKLNAMMPAASLVLFAPRFVLSTFQRLNPLMWGRLAMHPAVAKEALRDAGAHVAFVAGALGIAQQAGYEVTWDPRSPVGLKIKKGNVTRDFGGGMVQTINFLAKMLTGTKITGTGEKQSLRDPDYGGDTNSDIVQRFVRSKLHPTLSYLWNAKEGENIVGRKFNALTDAIESLTPMYGSSVVESLKENSKTNPEETIADVIAALFGANISNYTPPEKAAKPISDEDFLKGNVDSKESDTGLSAEDKKFLGL